MDDICSYIQFLRRLGTCKASSPAYLCQIASEVLLNANHPTIKAAGVVIQQRIAEGNGNTKDPINVAITTLWTLIAPPTSDDATEAPEPAGNVFSSVGAPIGNTEQ
eukprot:TRINITY_DN21_c5_g1_i1.p1 TRINITY_DN21_c5_g1~~TRINITY_DN21_c5_g1_i1.p1  ORF type:complete len:106 (-),score=26.86 TRINITY_DN21_c5_g1_i1:98-415(-)